LSEPNEPTAADPTDAAPTAPDTTPDAAPEATKATPSQPFWKRLLGKS